MEVILQRVLDLLICWLGVREIFLVEGAFALLEGGPPRGGTWQIVTAGRSVKELEREVFRMAAGGEEGCRLVRDQHFIEELVDTLGSWIEAQDLAVPGLIDIAEGQPLRLKLIRAILQAADDPDRDFLLQAGIGLPVGILEPLPRTPHVFEQDKKWPLENMPWEPSLAWVPNYGSTRDHLDFAKAKFDEEIEEGLMEKMSPDTFKERFGDNTAIAALAVIVEDEEVH